MRLKWAVAVTLALWALACLCPAAAARPVQELAKPDFTLYHTMQGVFESVEAQARRCSDIMRVENHTLSAEGYSSTMTVVTVEPGGLTANHSGKARLLLNFGEHGRELISSEIALAVLEALCNQTARAILLQEFGIPAAAAEAALSKAVFQIVPMENVRGRELVEKGALCERKNGRGVDPNRNWEVHWGHKEKDYDPSEEFPGAKPFSEPEAAMLRTLGEAFRPHVWVSVHSGMEALFMPYDHKDSMPGGVSAEATLGILKGLNAKTCGGRCAVGSGGKAVGYLAHGTATDYMHDVLGAALAMTWEVYGDMNAAYEDCFRMFNPLGKAQYDKVVRAWTAAVFALVAALPGHPGVPPLKELAVAAADGQGDNGPWSSNGINEGTADAAGGGTAAAVARSVESLTKAGQVGDAGSTKEEEHMQRQPGAALGAVQPWAAALSAAAGTSRMVAGSGWFLSGLGVTCIGAVALWSHPRSRFWLSKWLGRRRRQIPL